MEGASFIFVLALLSSCVQRAIARFPGTCGVGATKKIVPIRIEKQ